MSLKSRLRILMLAPQLPFPADKGTRIRNFGLARELARRHDVGILCFGEPNDSQHIAGLEAFCNVIGVIAPPSRYMPMRALRTCFDPVPDLGRRLESSEFDARLREAMVAWDWDAVLVEGLEMMPHWHVVCGQYRGSSILDEHNAEWLLQLRASRLDGQVGRAVASIYSAIQAAKLRWFERLAIESVSGVVTVSSRDAAAIRAIGRPRDIAIVPNGVDTNALTRREKDPGGEIVLFTGTMDFRPNVDGVTWFVSKVWPLIRKVRPSARFVIAGRDPTRSIRDLGRRGGVEVVGAVRDMREQFDRACVYVAPLRIGGGMRLKILEAFAFGVPVVSTPLGAEGIDLVNGQDAVLAEDPERFASAVIALLGSSTRRAELALAGRTLVESHYDWRSIVPALEQLIERTRTATVSNAKLSVANG